MKPTRQICTVANYLYIAILRFEKNDLSSKQSKLINQLKVLIENSIGHAKYSTQALANYSGQNNVGVIFDETKDYIRDIKKSSKKIKDELKLEDIDFKKPDSKWSKYSLMDHYERAYKIAYLIDDTLTSKKKKEFKNILNSVERGYHMAYRICRKLEEYKGTALSKDKFIDDFYGDRFKKLNIHRFNREYLKTEGDLRYFSDGSIWNFKKQEWIKQSETRKNILKR